MSMRCKDLHVNVLDAAGDRIMAGALLNKHDTNWQLWTKKSRKRRRRRRSSHASLGDEDAARLLEDPDDQRVGHILGHMKKGGKKFPNTPKMWRREKVDACRLFGSLEGNKVHGDLHITARGHGYLEPGQTHLEHSSKSLFSQQLNRRGMAIDKDRLQFFASHQ